MLNAVLHRIFHHFSGLFHQILRLPDIDKSSGNNIRTGKDLIGILLQCQNGNHDSVLRQMLAIPQDNISHISYPKTIYQKRAGLYMAGHLGRLLIQLQNIPCLQDKDMIVIESQIPGDPRLTLQMTVFAVNRNGILRLHQRVDQLDLFLAGMAGYMCILEDHVRSLHGQLVNHLGNCFFIARNGIGTENHRISRLDNHLLMHVEGDSGKRRHGLSLASRSDQHYLIIRIIFHLFQINQRIFRNIQISKLRGSGNNIHHASSFHHHFSAVLVSRIDNLANPVYIGGKGRDNNSCIPVFRKNIIEGPPYRPL